MEMEIESLKLEKTTLEKKIIVLEEDNQSIKNDKSILEKK